MHNLNQVTQVISAILMKQRYGTNYLASKTKGLTSWNFKSFYSKKYSITRSFIPFLYHYLFTYEKEGLGFTGALRIMNSIFYHTGIIEDQAYREFSEPWDIYTLDRCLPSEERGIVALNSTPELLAESQGYIEKGGLRKMVQEMREEGEEEKFVLAFSAEEKELEEKIGLSSVKERVKELVYSFSVNGSFIVRC